MDLRRCCLVAVITLGLLWVTAAAAAADPGRRVAVGLFGDSVTESVVIPHFQTEGLAAQLSAAETSYGFSPGGAGLIAANQYAWRFNAFGFIGLDHIPPLGWGLAGAQSGSFSDPGTDGPSGYSAITGASGATATTTVDNRDITVLYTTTQVPCDFSVDAAGRSWTIDTYRLTLAPEAAQYALILPPGRHTLTVHGSDCGGLVFDGIIAQKPLSPATTQMDIDNDGHAGRPPSTDLSTRVEEAILQRRYKVSVFLWGYIGELLLRRGPTARQYEQALLTRARLARMYGGRCLIVQPGPMPVSQRAVALVSSLERSVARQAGCTYTTALTHLWPSPAAGIKDGLVVIDGIHPTAAGYRRIAAALAPIIARLARS